MGVNPAVKPFYYPDNVEQRESAKQMRNNFEELRKHQNAVPPPLTVTVELTREQVCAISKLTCEKIEKINKIWTDLQAEESLLVEAQSAFKSAMSK